MRRSAVLSTGAALLALASFASGGEAQGFGVYEHDACSMARAGTGVAAPCGGGSAVYFNPAGIVGSSTRWNATFGGTLITLDFNHRDSASGVSTDAVKNNIPIPAAYFTAQLNDRIALGVGAFAPYGLKVEWPTTFGGRFLSYSSDLKTIYVQPTIAFRATPWLRIGGGLDYVYTDIELRQRVELSSQNTSTPGVTFAMLGVPVGTDFADARLSGTARSWTGHFGVIVEPHPRVSLGARYLMRTEARLSASAEFTQVATGITLPAGNPLGVPGGTPLDALLSPQFAVGSLMDQFAETTLPLPAQLVIGVSFKATSSLTLLADWQHVGWKTFESLPLDFDRLPDDTLYEDYRDTDGFRFGADYRRNRWNVRAGFLFHSAAAPPQTVTPLLPEGERAEATFGLGYTFSPQIRLDVAYQYIKQQDRRGRITEAPSRGSLAANTGIYTGGANLFGATFALGF